MLAVPTVFIYSLCCNRIGRGLALYEPRLLRRWMGFGTGGRTPFLDLLAKSGSDIERARARLASVSDLIAMFGAFLQVPALVAITGDAVAQVVAVGATPIGLILLGQGAAFRGVARAWLPPDGGVGGESVQGPHRQPDL